MLSTRYQTATAKSGEDSRGKPCNPMMPNAMEFISAATTTLPRVHDLEEEKYTYYLVAVAVGPIRSVINALLLLPANRVVPAATTEPRPRGDTVGWPLCTSAVLCAGLLAW
ncbi:jg27017 [Pararge aegeria aegeria]|uniref:Jg27017 protein n=1 Tax=Pararge aegeria aegeria TaxID=348720 RepID=A0A8S4SIT5_9NEOP|nr:jg27017 [Pararge aegeria aegeria]